MESCGYPESRQQRNRDHGDRPALARPALFNHQSRVFVTLDNEVLFLVEDTHLGDKAVTSAWNSVDVAMLACRLTKSFPEDEDVLGEVGLLDERVRPDTFHQVILQNDLFAVAHQDEQGLKAFNCKGTGWLLRRRRRLAGSRQKGPNSYNSFPWLFMTRLINF